MTTTEQTVTAQHTPGPWRARAVYYRNDLQSFNGLPLAVTQETVGHWGIYAPDEDGGQYTAGCICDVMTVDANFTPSTQEANAHLIAAAPELLAALREIHKLWCCPEPKRLKDWSARCDIMADYARAAIAKATQPGDTKE